MCFEVIKEKEAIREQEQNLPDNTSENTSRSVRTDLQKNTQSNHEPIHECINNQVKYSETGNIVSPRKEETSHTLVEKIPSQESQSSLQLPLDIHTPEKDRDVQLQLSLFGYKKTQL